MWKAKHAVSPASSFEWGLHVDARSLFPLALRMKVVAAHVRPLGYLEDVVPNSLPLASGTL